MGHDYKGGAETFHSFGKNVADLKKRYSFKNGYFGKTGSTSDSHIRHIESDNPLETAHDFYDRASYGGIEKQLSKDKWVTRMEDGTVLTMREISKSDGTPAVDINIRYSSNTGGVKQQKIHFVRQKGGKQ